jgi:hypothetical protein
VGNLISRRGAAGLLAVAGLATVAIVGLNGGSATAEPDPSGVLCGGRLSFNKPGKPSSLLDAKFRCNKDIQGFSIITPAGVDFFHSEAIVFGPDGNPSGAGEGFDCEGPIPGWGFGCRGNGKITYEDTSTTTGALAGHRIEVDLGLFRNPCSRRARRHPLRAFVTATYTRLKPTDDTTFTAVSEPFRLRRPSCPPLPSRRG